MFLWLHRYRLYRFRFYLAQKGFAQESIDRSCINMKPPAKNGKEGKSLDWPRDLVENVPVSPYFCPVLNEKSHK